ncbi:MAG: hypothetical protein H0U66_12100, partial [Gemmatimonadaceae bacterium]|nr:hypothetical protein [Gemmatimonadaceae bacterium]
MSSPNRTRALVTFAAASILAIVACSEQAPLAPNVDASVSAASQSSLARVGASRRLVALRDGRPAAAVVARIRAL